MGLSTGASPSSPVGILLAFDVKASQYQPLQIHALGRFAGKALLQQLGEGGEVLQFRVAEVDQLGDIGVGAAETPKASS
jgi:hypothetical protein